MRHKTYSMYGKAIDSNGNEHIVTVVGEYEQFKEKTLVTTDVIMSMDSNKKGTLTYEDTTKIRQIGFGYSICHEDDEFDEAKGIEIAKKRATNHPIGLLSSASLTMLTSDMCSLLVLGELSHIINNIDKYIGL